DAAARGGPRAGGVVGVAGGGLPRGLSRPARRTCPSDPSDRRNGGGNQMAERRATVLWRTLAVSATVVAAAALAGVPAVAQSDPNADAATMGSWAGLDKDLSGVTIKMAAIGGQPYE